MTAAPRRHLCLFTSEIVRSQSCFGSEAAGWIDRTEVVSCEYHPGLLDAESPALAVSRLFSATTILVSPGDLADPEILRATCAAFTATDIPFEIVAAERPLALVQWVASRAPELVTRLRQDGDVRPESPGWWRQRVEQFVSRNGDASFEPTAELETSEDLATFLARRR